MYVQKCGDFFLLIYFMFLIVRIFYFFLFHLLAADTTLRIWNAEDGRHLATLTGHLEGISDISWAPDSQIIASASDDKTIRLWNIHTVINSPPHNFSFVLLLWLLTGIMLCVEPHAADPDRSYPSC